MRHTFLSPHPDDAVLSCGGLMYQLVQSGEQVHVITLMAGPIPANSITTPLVEELIERWALGPNPVPERNAEDRCAVELLGGTVQFGPFPDAPFRANEHGSMLYPDGNALFGAIDLQDPVLTRIHEIVDWLDPQSAFYAPLGVGNHVDHRLTRNFLMSWKKAHPEVAIFLYEEYPYTSQEGSTVQSALDSLALSLTPVIHYLTDAAVEARIRASECYKSQISTFWSDAAQMGQSIRNDAAQAGEGRYAERLWKPV